MMLDGLGFCLRETTMGAVMELCQGWNLDRAPCHVTIALETCIKIKLITILET